MKWHCAGLAVALEFPTICFASVLSQDQFQVLDQALLNACSTVEMSWARLCKCLFHDDVINSIQCTQNIAQKKLLSNQRPLKQSKTVSRVLKTFYCQTQFLVCSSQINSVAMHLLLKLRNHNQPAMLLALVVEVSFTINYVEVFNWRCIFVYVVRVRDL